MNFYRNYELLIDGKKTGIKTTHPIPAVDCYMPDIEVFDYNEDGLKRFKRLHTVIVKKIIKKRVQKNLI